MKTALRKSLFWDVDIKSLEKKKHARFIIERVLEFGNKKDYQILKRIYGLRKIKTTAPKVNFQTRKSLNFWSLIFNIPKNKFKCSKMLSQQKPSAFWKR